MCGLIGRCALLTLASYLCLCWLLNSFVLETSRKWGVYGYQPLQGRTKESFCSDTQTEMFPGQPCSPREGRGFTVAERPQGLESHGTPTVGDDVGPPHHETKGQLCRDILESLRPEHQFYLSLSSELCLPHNPASRQMSVYLSVPELVPEKEEEKWKGTANKA